MNRLLFFSFLPFVLAACQTPVPDDAPEAPPATAVADAESDRAAIRAASEAWQTAARAGDPAALAALYTDDAIIQPANEPSVSGREAIADYFAAHLPPPDITLSTSYVVVSDAGDLAYEVGTSFDGWGKYLVVYRNVGDRWLMAADSWSTGEPPMDAN